MTLLASASLSAHHGSAEYHVDREVIVTGTVKEWRFTNPHTWVFLTVKGPSGKVEEWSGEGPPLQWASSRSWSATTLRTGDAVRLVLYPSRREPRGGLIKRIERDGRDPLVVSRPWLNER